MIHTRRPRRDEIRRAASEGDIPTIGGDCRDVVAVVGLDTRRGNAHPNRGDLPGLVKHTVTVDIAIMKENIALPVKIIGSQIGRVQVKAT